MNKPDPTKHCLCTGERSYRYRTSNRGVTTLVCKKCGKAEYSEQVQFQPERQPA